MFIALLPNKKETIFLEAIDQQYYSNCHLKNNSSLDDINLYDNSYIESLLNDEQDDNNDKKTLDKSSNESNSEEEGNKEKMKIDLNNYISISNELISKTKDEIQSKYMLKIENELKKK